MITVNTVALKEALNKVSKCAKNDKTAPLTQLIHIHTVDSNTIEFTTTDEKNIFSYFLKDETTTFEDMDVCVLVEQVTKLVNKFDSPKTDLLISETGNELKLRGNGVYTISIPVDSDGVPIEYPALDVGEPTTEIYKGSISSILAAARYCEGSITKLTYDIEPADYPRTNYYVSDSLVSLDGFLVTVVDGEFLPFATLISPTTMKLLSNFTDSGFTAYKAGSLNVFECDNCKLLSVEPDGLDAYPIEVANQIIGGIKGNSVNVGAGVLKNALDRLSLFTDIRYDNSIKFKFNSEGVIISTIDGSCFEQISAEPQNDDFECYINSNNLIGLIKAYNNEVLTITYGDETCIKIESDSISQLIVTSDLNE